MRCFFFNGSKIVIKFCLSFGADFGWEKGKNLLCFAHIWKDGNAQQKEKEKYSGVTHTLFNYSCVTRKWVIAFHTPSWFDWANQNKPR